MSVRSAYILHSSAAAFDVLFAFLSLCVFFAIKNDAPEGVMRPDTTQIW